MSRKIIVTGATSGFGKAIAEQFAQQGDELWLTGRREERLKELQKKLDAVCKVHIATFDVRRQEEVRVFAEKVCQTWDSVDILVNNAGLALGSVPIDQGNPEDWDTMIDTNIKGLLYVTKAIVPLMVRQRKGHIINIGSTAGKTVYQNGNVYCATKFAVDALSQTMRIDLLPHNIKVTSINPGMAETEFSVVRYKGDAQKAKSVYKGYQPLVAENIADIVSYCAGMPGNVCINDLTVTCSGQANSVYKLQRNP